MNRPGGVAAGLKHVRRLSRRRAARREHDAFVIDGPTLLGSALDADVEVVEVFTEDPSLAVVDRCRRLGIEVHAVARGRLEGMTDTRTPQPVVAVARPFRSVVVPPAVKGSLVVMLVDVSDPGNAGTLLRAAEAAGASAVVFADDTVDPYNPKCVRASAGSLFTVPVMMEVGALETLVRLDDEGYRTLGTVPRRGVPYDDVDLTQPTALVLGSEAHGLSADLAARLDDVVTIPMAGRAESLNVAMAGSVICFEAARQRRVVPGDGEGRPST